MKALGIVLIAPFYLIVVLVFAVMFSLAIYMVIFYELAKIGFTKLMEVFSNEDC